MLASVARLTAGRTVPQCALWPVLIGRTVGVAPEVCVKQIQFNSIQCVVACGSDTCRHEGLQLLEL